MGDRADCEVVMMPIYPPHTLRLLSEIDRADAEMRRWRALAVVLWALLLACAVVIAMEYTA